MIKEMFQLFKSAGQQKPERKPSPLLLEMQTVNENLQEIASILAAQKPPTIVVNSSPATAASTSEDFEPFEAFDSSGEDGSNV